jgi:nucleoside-diphosphate-sugar epimerase
VSTAFVTGGSGFIGGALVRRLVADGWTVRALARSDASAETVRERGAEPLRGDLDDVGAMASGAKGCEVAFHCAAHLGDWGRRADFERGNVQGTRNALAAARRAGVRRFVHVGTEAALLAGQPLVEVDERAPLRFDSPVLYSSTKARAEEAVIEANQADLETVVVRPRFVWGRGDRTLLPAMTEMVRSGRFAWIGGGRHRTSTTHVDNVVHGLLLAAQRGARGGVYFVTDGEPVVFRDFVTRLLATQGVTPPSRSLPVGVARAAAAASETAWRLLQIWPRDPPPTSRPPLTRFAVWVSALETTIDITRARTELGYEPVMTIDQGLEELQS